MRRVSQKVGRDVLAVTVVLVLTVPVQAKPREDRPWFERRIDPVVRMVKKLVVKTLGDGLSDPRP
jgi:hypothetical protein